MGRFGQGHMGLFGLVLSYPTQCDQIESVSQSPHQCVHLGRDSDGGGNSICASRNRSRIALFRSPCVALN